MMMTKRRGPQIHNPRELHNCREAFLLLIEKDGDHFMFEQQYNNYVSLIALDRFRTVSDVNKWFEQAQWLAEVLANRGQTFPLANLI